ncbi:hypothetical protein [Streptosporangium sp. NBC_01756]|uniref:hypothetical protein n=1 Tax=Streptosporangium sp. NBC_01756 TaxID=2975950 RepID=UPI002DDA03CD|nr:hypothetical protein [Streptosporangium sp. NBC_01756]WSC85333.1 hypothetical protein OIE48_34030 [Streptosporangium sp. NBC_01756]
MAADLLNSSFTDQEAKLVAAYEALKELAGDDLPPCAASNVRVALAALSVAVIDLGLVYEHLIDYDC